MASTPPSPSREGGGFGKPPPEGTKAKGPVQEQLFCFSQLGVALGSRKHDAPQHVSSPNSTEVCNWLIFEELQEFQEQK